jgi:aspartyl-tRNA synthetase
VAAAPASILGTHPPRIRRRPQGPAARRTSTADRFDFLWVVDFPLLRCDKEDEPLVLQPPPVHRARSPRTSPCSTSDPDEGARPALRHRASTASNSAAAPSASINPAVQKTRLRGHPARFRRTSWTARFGYMLEAFSLRRAAPRRHRSGFDRVVAMLAGRSSIRDILAFPKNQNGRDLMADCPKPAAPKQRLATCASASPKTKRSRRPEARPRDLNAPTASAGSAAWRDPAEAAGDDGREIRLVANWPTASRSAASCSTRRSSLR